MFRSRTQKSIRKVATGALEARIQGITHVRDMVQLNLSRDYSRELIASMNYGVHQCMRELKMRGAQ